MPEFAYHFIQYAHHTVFVNAPTRKAGEREAWDKLPGSLCHQCSSDYDMSGDWEPNFEADQDSDAEVSK